MSIAAAQTLQQRASNPAAHTWVSASAGSGKTTVLVNRLLRLLLGDETTPPTAPHRILCLTYTKAAAMEMRVRLEKILAEWATTEATVLQNKLSNLTGEQPSQDMISRARALFARVTDDPNGLRIQTIHAFCQSVLARFPIEANVMPGFTALDEYQAAPLFAAALDRAWHSDESTAWRAAKDFLGARYALSQLRSILPGLVRDWPEMPDVIENAGGEDAYWRACFTALNAPEDAKEIWAGQFENDVLPMDFLRAWWKHKPNEKLEKFMALSSREREETRYNYLQLFLTADMLPRKRLLDKTMQQHFAVAQLESALAEQDRLLALVQKSKDQKLAQSSAAMALCTARVAAAYQQIKSERGVLDFADLITRTRQLLTADGMDAWVHYRLDGGIDHILLDEAQDTAPAQWQIIRALSEEFFVDQGRTERPRSLFVVGDLKQSIYSFQGADAELFHALQVDFAARAEAAQAEFQIVPLSHSFRTAENLLQLVDTVFADGHHTHALHGDNGTIQHHSIHTAREGAARIYPPVMAVKKQKFEGLLVRGDDETEYGHNARLAAQIATRVADWLKQKRAVAGTAQAIQPRDIMILLQQRTTLADMLLSALRAAGVPVLGNDRLQLLDAVAVQDLICFCQFLLLPNDDLNLAQLLRSPFIDLNETMLGELAMRRAKGQSLWSALRENAGAQKIYDYLHDWLARADILTAYQTLAGMLALPCPAAHSGMAALHARLGTEFDDAVHEFLQLALREGDADQPLGLQAFLDWITRTEIEIKRDMAQHDENAVRILTVHGAKGLEAPVVILADASEIPNKPARAVVSDLPAPYFLYAPSKDAEGPAFDRSGAVAARAAEHQRLLYVALTRASHELHVFGKASTKGEMKDNNWYDQILSAAQRMDAWSDESDIWHYGADDVFVSANELPQALAIKSGWLTSQTAIAAPEILRPIAVTELAQRGVKTAGKIAADPDARQRGVIIHRLLELLPNVAEAQRADAAERFLSRELPKLDPAKIQTWSAEVLRVIHAPETAAFFGPNARAEVTISGQYQNIPVIGTVDRFYVTDSELGILDFKTGTAADGTMPEAYARQLQIYAKLLSEIYPGRAMRVGILWTASLQFQALQVESLAAAA